MRIAFVISFLLIVGCSQIRENEFDVAFRQMLLSVRESDSTCAMNERQLDAMSTCFSEYKSMNDIDMPFIGFVDIGRTNRLSTGNDSALSQIEVRWKGIFDQESIDRQYRKEVNFCFTVFMVTSNDAVRVLSFERFRNNGKCRGTQGRYIRYCDEIMNLSIWDGILPDRNHPEYLFDEQYKEVVAVQTERPFNYCYYLSFPMIASAIDRHPRQRIYKLVTRTEVNWVFASNAVLSDFSDAKKQ